MKILPLIVLIALPASAREKRQLDFQALLNTQTRFEEFQKLLDDDIERISEPTVDQLEKFQELTRLVECPQANDEPPLYALLYQPFHDDWPFSRKPDSKYFSAYDLKQELDHSGPYPPEEPPSGEAPQTLEARQPSPNLSPALSNRLAKPVLVFFDKSGLEHHPFGGSNMIHDGYLLDLNNDGILEKVDTTNWGVRKGYSTQTLSVVTVEPEPKVLLNVLFEWHPNQFKEEEPWFYACRDLDGDKNFEVVLGPQHSGGEVKATAVFSWDAGEGTFIQNKQPEGQDHYLLLKNEQAWEQLKELKSPLPYALQESKPIENNTEDPEKKSTPSEIVQTGTPPFQPVDSATLTDDQLWEAMGSGRNKNQVERETFPATKFPEKFWKLPPREAALALVENNRSAEHRQKFKVFFTKEEIPCPDSGWVVSRYFSSSCYTYTTELFAINFGVENPRLITINSSSLGVVGARPLTDQTGYEVREVPLDPDLATHLAQTIWYLDQIRTNAASDDYQISSVSSTADGSGAIYFCGEANRTLASGTHWTTNTISGRWKKEYNREVMFNFGNWLINQQLPIKLGKKWPAANLVHHSLATPEEERLKPRHDPGTRQHLTESARKLLKDQSIPPEFSAWLLDMVAEVGLRDLKDDIEDFSDAIPPATQVEKQLNALEKKFAAQEEAVRLDYNQQNELFKNPEYQELYRLRNQSHLFPSVTLAAPLAHARENLALLADRKALAEASREKNRQANWALKQLQIHHEDLYRIFLEERFIDADNLALKAQALSAIVHKDPEAALILAPDFTPEEWKEFSVTIAPLVEKSAPELSPQLLDGLLRLADSAEHGFGPRTGAIKSLVSFKAPLRFPDKRVDQLLARLAEDPKNKLDQFVPQAVPREVTKALFLRNRNPDQWDILMRRLSEKSTISTDGYLDLLSIHLTRGPMQRKQVLTYLEERIETNHGRLNTVFEIALADDLRELAPLLEPLATPSPDLVESKTTNYATSYSKPDPSDRYHRARQVLQIWHQDNPLQKFRTYLAFRPPAPPPLHSRF